MERQSLFANSISYLYAKRLPQKSYHPTIPYTSVALCTVGTSVTPCAYYIRLLVYHSIFQKNHKLFTKLLYILFEQIV